MAELSAAPADGDEAMLTATSLVAEALMADDISLATADATAVTSEVQGVEELVAVTLWASRIEIDGRRTLPLLLRSPGVYVLLTGSSDRLCVMLQWACHEPIRALVAATHLPFAGTDPTRLAHP